VKENYWNILGNFFDRKIIGKFVGKLRENRKDIGTAVYVAIFRNLCEGSYIGNFLECEQRENFGFLLDSLEAEDVLMPFLVFFIQNFEKSRGSIFGLKGQGFRSIDEFIKRYLIVESGTAADEGPRNVDLDRF
jgi:hypothetical protein